MNWWQLEPRDPLMIRDGRPFGLDTDGARSLDFPTPSVVAGTLRTHIGFSIGGGTRFALSPDEAREIEIGGPILVQLGDKSNTTWLPAPRDLVLFERENASTWPRHRLAPGAAWTNGTSGLPDGMLPVEGVKPLPNKKPAGDAPAFWDLPTFQAWLHSPVASDGLSSTNTRPGLTHETRIHVAINPETGTGYDGKLFKTDGLRFVERAKTMVDGDFQVSRFAIMARCTHAKLAKGVVPLGGERRVSSLVAGTDPLAGLKAPDLAGQRRARVVLLTPAIFAEGAAPKHIGGATVVASAVGRPNVVSGWDMAYKNENGRFGAPKPVRRCAPAGSVYWVELPETVDAAKWAASVHLQAISSDLQDRRDGFGLAAVGVWR